MRRTSGRHEQEEHSGGAPEWLVTYSDLVTLLLTFFIMLFSMAVIDKQKFSEVANSLKSTFMHIGSGERYDYNRGQDILSIIEENNKAEKGESNTSNDTDEQPLEQGSGEAEDDYNLKSFQEEIQREIQKLNLQDYVGVIEGEKTITLRLNSVILFDSGRADIKESGMDILRKTGALLKDMKNDVVVQGHTDNLPINTLLFPSNWELSTKRATNIVIFLINQCGADPTRMTATGNGEFRPIAPNNTEKNRQKNRRIDIIVVK